MDECLKNVKEIIDQLESAIITLPFWRFLDDFFSFFHFNSKLIY
jgi:hypothetical protein